MISPLFFRRHSAPDLLLLVVLLAWGKYERDVLASIPGVPELTRYPKYQRVIAKVIRARPQIETRILFPRW